MQTCAHACFYTGMLAYTQQYTQACLHTTVDRDTHTKRKTHTDSDTSQKHIQAQKDIQTQTGTRRQKRVVNTDLKAAQKRTVN